jgi:hypothetical protein
LEQHLHTANAKKLLPTNFNRVAALPKARSIGELPKTPLLLPPNYLNVKLVETDRKTIQK